LADISQEAEAPGERRGNGGNASAAKRYQRRPEVVLWGAKTGEAGRQKLEHGRGKRLEVRRKDGQQNTNAYHGDYLTEKSRKMPKGERKNARVAQENIGKKVWMDSTTKIR